MRPMTEFVVPSASVAPAPAIIFVVGSIEVTVPSFRTYIHWTGMGIGSVWVELVAVIGVAVLIKQPSIGVEEPSRAVVDPCDWATAAGSMIG